ncbi:MAG: hypothetical protein ABI728_04330 [Betaproteobacteria bacterium]
MALVLMGCGAALADDDVSGGRAGGATTETAAIASQKVRSADSWFNLDALDLNVYGLSYHPDREAVHRANLDNQVNPGLGLHYRLADDERGITFAELAAYRDSGRHWAKFLSLGYQFKWGERLRIGGALAAVNSQTYNQGVAFVAMIPLITYDMGRIKLNAVYFPKFGNYNRIEAFGFYLSIPFGQWLR